MIFLNLKIYLIICFTVESVKKDTEIEEKEKRKEWNCKH